LFDGKIDLSTIDEQVRAAKTRQAILTGIRHSSAVFQHVISVILFRFNVAFATGEKQVMIRGIRELKRQFLHVDYMVATRRTYAAARPGNLW